MGVVPLPAHSSRLEDTLVLYLLEITATARHFCGVYQSLADTGFVRPVVQFFSNIHTVFYYRKPNFISSKETDLILMGCKMHSKHSVECKDHLWMVSYTKQMIFAMC